MPGMQQLALTGGESPLALKCIDATFYLGFIFSVLILPAEVLVYIETEILGLAALPAISQLISISMSSLRLLWCPE